MNNMGKKIHMTARLLEREGVVTQGVSEKHLIIYLYAPHGSLEVRINNATQTGALHLIDDTLPLRNCGPLSVWLDQSLFWHKNVESFVGRCKLVLNSPALLEKYRGNP